MPKLPTTTCAEPIAPFWQTNDHRTVRLYHGNVTDVLSRLPARSVHCVVTSPPYWGHRSGAEKISGPSKHDRDRSFRSSRNGVDSTLDGEVGTYKTVGWEPTCACRGTVVPCTVLDPFIGSGTTCEVSVELGRASVGIDLNDKYLRNNAIPRVEGALLRRADTAKLATRKRAPFKPNGGKLGILKR